MLATLLERHYPAPVELLDERSASEGYSDETLVVACRDGGGAEHRIVLRRHQPGGLLRGETDPRRHFEVLRALGGTDVPAPRALWFDEVESVIAMEHVPGDVFVPWSREGRAFLANAGDGPLGREFAEILARIHRLDPGRFGFLADPGPGRSFAEARVERLAGIVDEYRREPDPIVEDALGWLRANAPVAPRVTVVHHDYRTGNLIFRDGRVVAVLDWEFCCLGDPTLDVAWVCAPSNRTGTDLVSFLLPREAFLERYAEIAGWEPDPAAVRFWEVYMQVRHLAIWLSAATDFLDGRTRDLRLARMGLTLPLMRRMIAELLGYP